MAIDNYINAKNGVFSLYKIIYARWVEKTVILIKYRAEVGGLSYFTSFAESNCQVRIEFNTEEESHAAMDAIRKACGLKAYENTPAGPHD